MPGLTFGATISSPTIAQQLKATGIAQVMVILKSLPTSARGLAAALASRARNAPQLRAHFTSSANSQNSQIARATRSVSATRARSAVTPYRMYPNLGVILGTVDRAGLSGLERESSVAVVAGAPQLSPIWPEAARAASLSTTTTWGIERLKVPALWAQGLSGKGIRVGHLDTGVDVKHPALRKAVTAFAEFDWTGARLDPSPDPYDSNDHGTHTAGTIAGRAVQGRNIGVAPGADLVSALVIEGGNVIARVLGGLDWCIGQDVKVISLSLGLRGWWEDFIPIIDILRARNILPVIAVGNEGPGTSRSPGNYSQSLSIGAHDKNDRVPLFSSSQSFSRPDPLVPDLIAPGVDVISAQPGNRYQSMDGTSMATPHVAGLAALLLEAKPSSTVGELQQAIYASCQLPSGVPPERGNRGIPNAIDALAALTGTVIGRARKRVSVETPAPRRRRPSRRTGSKGAAKRRTATKRTLARRAR